MPPFYLEVDHRNTDFEHTFEWFEVDRNPDEGGTYAPNVGRQPHHDGMERMIAEAGFHVSQRGNQFIATSAGDRYVATDPVCLLGLIKLVEVRGWSWHPTDEEIDTALQRLGGNGNPPPSTGEGM